MIDGYFVLHVQDFWVWSKSCSNCSFSGMNKKPQREGATSTMGLIKKDGQEFNITIKKTEFHEFHDQQGFN